MKEASLPPGFQDMLAFGLVEALLGRRSWPWGLVDGCSTEWTPSPCWARGCWSDMQQFSTGGVNVNFLTGEEGAKRVHAAYGAVNYKRLVELKNKYDPQNMFRLNQNIPPSV